MVARPLGIEPLDDRGARHMFVVVADEPGGEVRARYSYGPSGPAHSPGSLVNLVGTGSPTDLDDAAAWESLQDGGADGVTFTQIDAPDEAVIIAGEHVNAALGTPDNPGTTQYLAPTTPLANLGASDTQSVGNSNTAAMAVAQSARIATSGVGDQQLPRGGVRAPGHGQSHEIPVNQSVIDREVERRSQW